MFTKTNNNKHMRPKGTCPERPNTLLTVLQRYCKPDALAALTVSILMVLLLQTPGISQCSSSIASTPVTVNDETSAVPDSRQFVNGAGTSVNTSTPGQIKVDVDYSTKRIGTWTPILTSSTTFTATNITAPTVNTAGTVANNSGASGVLIKYPTTTSSGNAAGVHSTAYTDTEYRMGPIYCCRVQTGSSIATQRIWVGLTASALSGSATPTANCAAFRFDTGASDSAFMCYTANGTSGTATSSGVTVAASTTYDLVIDMSNSSQILFYINGTLVGTATSTLPSSSATLGPEMTITTLTTAAENFSVGTMRLESY